MTQVETLSPEKGGCPLHASSAVVVSDRTHRHRKPSSIDQEAILRIKYWDAFLGLDSLQAGHTEWLNGSALDVPTEFRYLQQPPEVRQLINLLDTSADAGLFRHSGGTSLEHNADKVRQSLEGTNHGGDSKLLKSIRAHEFTMWPVDVGMHWVVLILQMQQTGGSKEFDHVAQAVIIDTDHDPLTVGFVLDRLKTVLAAGGISFARTPELLLNMWVPPQDDGWSCGLRCYAAMSEFMQRVTRLYLAGKTYEDSLWEPMPSWFLAQSVREEMAGLCAAMCVRELKYKARIAIELVDSEHTSRKGYKKKSARARQENRGADYVSSQVITYPSPS
ncbi:hypothetical protein JX266_002051 [Neoarthrinium moseri]|nr:hypothetical protein JX266_002051 [Neoarthrinium moseri]